MIRLFKHLNIFILSLRMKMLSIHNLFFFHQQRSKKNARTRARARARLQRKRNVQHSFSSSACVFFNRRCKTNIDHMSFNAPINEERSFKRVDFCLYEMIAFRFAFKDNSSASILIQHIELITQALVGLCI